MTRGRKLLFVCGVAAVAMTVVLQYLAITRRRVPEDSLQAVRGAKESDQKRARSGEAYLKSEAEKRDAAGIRLTDVERFPANERAMVRRVISALGPSDAKPEQYIAIIERQNDGYHFDLRYEADRTDYHWNGPGNAAKRYTIR